MITNMMITEATPFTLGDVQTYAQTSSVKEEQNFVVFADYTIGNPQFKRC